MIYAKNIASLITTVVMALVSALAPVPDKLASSLKYAGLGTEALEGFNCSQVVLVESLGSRGYLSFFEKDDSGRWVQNEALTAGGWVGSRGVGHAAEGIPVTPMGLFRVGSAFYTGARPDTGLSSFAITPDTYWVDDPNSAYYNQRVVGTADMDWNSAEDMYISSYVYGFVIEYNTANIIRGAGSAFFFHVFGEPTEGCVGTDTSTVLAYLSALDASKNPCILIV